MKKLLALSVLTIFAFGFGAIASAAESARSNSPLSKVEPAMIKEEAPAEKTEAMVPKEVVVPPEDEDAIALDENGADDLLAPAEEDEVPAAPSDIE